MSLDRLERQLVAAVAMDKPRIPEAGRLVWQWFLELSETRTAGFAANPISYAEIDAYARLHRLPIGMEHVALIRAMDRALIDKWRRQTPGTAPDGVDRLPSVSSQAINPALFDAMFG